MGRHREFMVQLANAHVYVRVVTGVGAISSTATVSGGGGGGFLSATIKSDRTRTGFRSSLKNPLGTLALRAGEFPARFPLL